MKGPEYLKTSTIAYLTGAYTAKCTELEARLALAAGTIPPPATYSPTDQPELEELTFPVVITEVLEISGMADVDVDAAGEPTFSVRYPMRVHVMVRYDVDDEHGRHDVPGAEKARDRLVLATVELLIARPTLGTTDARVRPNTITARFLPIAEDLTGRPVSVGTIACDVVVDEQLAVPVLGVAPTTVTVSTTPLP